MEGHYPQAFLGVCKKAPNPVFTKGISICLAIPVYPESMPVETGKTVFVTYPQKTGAILYNTANSTICQSVFCSIMGKVILYWLAKNRMRREPADNQEEDKPSLAPT